MPKQDAGHVELAGLQHFNVERTYGGAYEVAFEEATTRDTAYDRLLNAGKRPIKFFDVTQGYPCVRWDSTLANV